VSALQTIPTFLPNKGIVIDKPEEVLSNNYSSADSRNVEFYNEYLRGRLGLDKFDSQQLSGPLLLIEQFWKFNSTWYWMICTTKDIYKYDFNNKRFDILTPVYTTGTIEIQSAALNVVLGSGTAWSTELKAGDYIKIGSGDIHTGSTWYEIDSVDSDTQLTLKTAAVETAASTAYVARKIFNGGSADFWHARSFYDKNLGEVWLATNGVDTPIRYTGTGQVQALSNLPTSFVSAKYIEVYKDRVFWLHTIESGNQPQRIRWSEVGDCEDYDDLDFQDFVEGGYWITGSLVWNGYHIVFRERDAQVGRYSSSSDSFTYETSNSCAGAWAPRSITANDKYIFYYGPDNRFHSWNLLTDNVISEEIDSYCINFDPNLEQDIFGYQVESRNQIRWFVPHNNPDYMNACITYDYNQGILHIWEYASEQACNIIGEYLNQEDFYVDDDPWAERYVDEQDGFWDSRNFLSGAPQIVYGGSDGYIRDADIGYTDDGEDYTRKFSSSRMNFDLPDTTKRLWKQQHWLESDISGEVKVSLRKDDRIADESLTHTISLVDADKDVVKKNITWDRHGVNFRTSIEATNHFSLLGWLNYLYAKGKTNR